MLAAGLGFYVQIRNMHIYVYIYMYIYLNIHIYIYVYIYIRYTYYRCAGFGFKLVSLQLRGLGCKVFGVQRILSDRPDLVAPEVYIVNP